MFKLWDTIKRWSRWRPSFWPTGRMPARDGIPPELFLFPEEEPEAERIEALDITSQTARMSAIMVCLPFRAIYPVPDGTISQGDRQCVAYQYAGVLAGAPSAAPTTKTVMSPILLFPRKRAAGQL